jgi:hypothetical protein
VADLIAKSKLILEAVDTYHARPDAMNRTALRAVIMAELESAGMVAIRELERIVNAKRFDRSVFDDDTAFADWAQSRARHTLKECDANAAMLGLQRVRAEEALCAAEEALGLLFHDFEPGTQTLQHAAWQKVREALGMPVLPYPGGLRSDAPITEGDLAAALQAACLRDTPESRKDMRRALEAVFTRGLAPTDKVQMPDKARAGIEVLHQVVESLLTTSRYVDEEGGATQALADLSSCMADPPFRMASGVTPSQASSINLQPVVDGAALHDGGQQ